MSSIKYTKVVFREPVRIFESSMAMSAVIADQGNTLVRVIDDDSGDDRLEVTRAGSQPFEVPWHMVSSAMREQVPATEKAKAKPAKSEAA